MNGRERRFEILALLEGATKAVSGAEIAERCGVSRQVIVHDIALLRREGNDILSTHHGYLLQRHGGPCRMFQDGRCRLYDRSTYSHSLKEHWRIHMRLLSYQRRFLSLWLR